MIRLALILLLLLSCTYSRCWLAIPFVLLKLNTVRIQYVMKITITWRDICISKWQWKQNFKTTIKSNEMIMSTDILFPSFKLDCIVYMVYCWSLKNSVVQIYLNDMYSKFDRRCYFSDINYFCLLSITYIYEYNIYWYFDLCTIRGRYTNRKTCLYTLNNCSENS